MSASLISKAIRFSKHGSLDTLSLQDVAFPATVPDGHVRIKLHSRPINPADILFITGFYNNSVGDQIAQGKPQTVGSEGAGVISAVGVGVTKFKVGQRVYVAANFPNTRTYSEYCDAPEADSFIVPLPDAVDFGSGCQLFINPLTALGFLADLKGHGLVAGDYYVVTAANSALIKILLQISQKRGDGYKAIGIVRRESQKQEVLDLGAAEVIVSENEDITKRILEITGGKGVAVAYDAVGGGPITSSVADAIGNKGVLYIYGLLDPSPLTFNVGRYVFSDASLRGWWLGHFLGRKDANVPQLIEEFLGYLADKSVTLSYVEFDFVTQWKEAFEYSKSSGQKGKAILVSK